MSLFSPKMNLFFKKLQYLMCVVKEQNIQNAYVFFKSGTEILRLVHQIVINRNKGVNSEISKILVGT